MISKIICPGEYARKMMAVMQFDLEFQTFVLAADQNQGLGLEE
ncbi:MAG: hypothetical protein WBZ36_25080 [Candidatus Nitrosopolaris sp.]